MGSKKDNPKRLYQPAWDKLKKSIPAHLELAALPIHHQRIFKAISKEKDKDLVYKMVLSENCKSAKLVRKKDKARPNILILELLFSLGLDDLI